MEEYVNNYKTKLEEKYGRGSFRARMGAEALKELLEQFPDEALVYISDNNYGNNANQNSEEKYKTIPNCTLIIKFISIVYEFSISNIIFYFNSNPIH